MHPALELACVIVDSVLRFSFALMKPFLVQTDKMQRAAHEAVGVCHYTDKDSLNCMSGRAIHLSRQRSAGIQNVLHITASNAVAFKQSFGVVFEVRKD